MKSPSARLATPFWWLYQTVYALVLMIGGPFFFLRRFHHYRAALRGRLARFATPPGRRGGLWVHAVSVGEVGVAATLARALAPDEPALVTTITPTGQDRARAAFRGRSEVAYLPFELGFAVRRFFERFAPRALVLVEGDYWPLLLHAARRRGLPIAVVNARVGDRSFARQLFVQQLGLRRFLRPLYSGIQAFGAQTTEDARRLTALGVPAERITVTGNLKYETPEPHEVPALAAALSELAAGRAVLVAGSTMAGEEAQVLDAFATLGSERALLVLAPRHPERFTAVCSDVAARGFVVARRSTLPAATEPRPAVLLLDSLGELAGLYRYAQGAFIGGTLVPTGGHNPLEAARFGVPVAVGPSMENFRQVAEEFDRAGAWARVADAAELAGCWNEWLSSPTLAQSLGARATGLITANQGALAKTLAMLQPLLASVREKPDG